MSRLPTKTHAEQQHKTKYVTKETRQDQAVKLPRIENINSIENVNYKSLANRSDISTTSEPPSLTRWESEDDLDIIWTKDNTVTELRHLAVSLGINNHINKEPKCKTANIRWNPAKESVTQEWWKQSRKWKKRYEETKTNQYPRHDGRPTRQPIKRQQRRNTVVNVPGIGCSYRLPVVNKRTIK